MDDQDKKFPEKKEYESNNPLKRDDYRGNEFADETDLKELTKQDIEQADLEEDLNQGEEIEGLEEAESKLASLTEDEIAEGVNDPLLKKLLERLRLRKKKKKSLNYLNNDLAPDLGNEGLSTTSMSKAEMKKKAGVLKNISSRLFQAFRRNPALKSEIQDAGKDLKDKVDMNDMDRDGVADNVEQQQEHKEQHIRQLADAINDIGEHSKKGRWADGLSDTNVKGIDPGPKKGGGGRGV